jgi:hypothetical protein
MIIMNNMKTLNLGNDKEAAERAQSCCTRPDWEKVKIYLVINSVA